METFREGRHRAEQLLLANAGELGLLGSSKAYQQVWARDSMICSLGLLLCADAEGKAVHQRSLETLRKFQLPLGKVPQNVGYANVAETALIAHGLSGRAMGYAGQSWSTAMFILAYDAVEQGRVSILNSENGWYVNTN